MTQANRHYLVSAALFAAEALWIWAALRLLTAATEGGFPTWPTWAFYPGGALAYAVLRRQRLTIKGSYVARGVLLAIGLLIAAIASGGVWAALGMLFMAPFIAWRGWVSVAGKVTFDSMRNRFQAGTIMVVLIVAVASFSGLELPHGGPLVTGFFVLSFLALAMGRAEWGGGARPVAWALVSLGAVALVFVAGLAIARVTPPAADAASAGVQWVWSGWVNFVEQRLPGPPEMDPNATPSPTPTAPVPEVEPRELSPLMQTILTYAALAVGVIVMGLVALATLMMVWYVVRRWLERLNATGIELESLEADPLFDWRKWIIDARNFLLRLLWMVGIRLSARQADGIPHLLYRLLQRWGRRRGVVRTPDQTPKEYLDCLSGAWPEYRGVFEQITQTYVAAHYSPAPPGPTAIEETLRSWRVLSKAPGPSRTRFASAVRMPRRGA